MTIRLPQCLYLELRTLALCFSTLTTLTVTNRQPCVTAGTNSFLLCVEVFIFVLIFIILFLTLKIQRQCKIFDSFSVIFSVLVHDTGHLYCLYIQKNYV